MKLLRKDIVKAQMNVNNNIVNVMRVGSIDYISLTDLAMYANPNV